MEYVYSAMLLHSAGKEITEDALGNVLKAAGVESDAARSKALVAALSGIDIEEAMSTAVAMPMAGAAAAPAAGAPEGEAKDEKPPEDEEDEGVSEEEAVAGLGALFG